MNGERWYRTQRRALRCGTRADRRKDMREGSAKHDRVRGVLLGTAVGDALGLPAEGMSRQRIQKLYRGIWHHRFVLKRGMTSDDTDHAVFVAQSLLRHPHSPELFAKRLARCLRWWLLSLPAGVGLATLKATLRLWAGFSPTRSGVPSAGNGPAMRSAVIGAFFCASPRMIDAYTEASALITHSDRRALIGSRAVAYLTAWTIREGLRQRPAFEELEDILQSAGPQDSEWIGVIRDMRHAHIQGLAVEEFAQVSGMDKGVSGYIYHSVPVAIYAWFEHFGDFRQALETVLNCGGDTDTTGAITGALAGAVSGVSGFPPGWINGIAEWPRGVKTLVKIADRLAACSSQPEECQPITYCWPATVPRNLCFLILVLLHGLRRLMPPY